MGSEYNMDELIIALKSENVFEEIVKSNDILLSLRYYRNKENVATLSSKILALPDNDRFACIKGLVRIYPLSDVILKAIMDGYNRPDELQDQLIEWFDSADVFVESLRLFTNMCTEAGFSVQNNNLIDQLQEYEEKKQKCQQELDNLKELKINNLKAKQEVDEIEKEVNNLREQYSTESINRKKQEKTRELKEWQKHKTNADKDLIDLDKQLEAIKGKVNNGKFERALEALTKVVATFPNDEVQD